MKLLFRINLVLFILAAGLLARDLVGTDLSTQTLYPVVAETTTHPAQTETVRTANPFVPLVEPPQKNSVVRGDSIFSLANQLDQRDFTLAAFAADAGGVDPAELASCKALVEQTLTAVGNDLVDTIEEMSLYLFARTPRGLANSREVQLRCGEITESELVSVLVHELGHVVDLGHLRGNPSSLASTYRDGEIIIPIDDPSVEFYSLSWQTTDRQKYSAERRDFVSGYAQSDAFEDFAESFNFYLLHGSEFRRIAGESSILQAKYDFLRDEVFDGVEFDGAEMQDREEGQRVWDTTLVDYDLPAFLARG